MIYSAEEARKAAEHANSLESQLSVVCDYIKRRAEEGRFSCEICVRSPHPNIVSELERLGFKVEKYFEGIERDTYIINW